MKQDEAEAVVTDPAELALVMKGIKSGLGGCVDWDIKAIDRVRRDLVHHNLTPEAVQRKLIEYVRNGGGVIQTKEVREIWKDRFDYWYKAIAPFPELPKGLFVEMVLVDPDPELPEIELVNAHE